MFNSHRSRPLTENVEAFHLQRDTQRLLARRISAIVTSCPIYFTERELSLTLRRSEGPRNETRPARPLNCWSVCELGAKFLVLLAFIFSTFQYSDRHTFTHNVALQWMLYLRLLSGGTNWECCHGTCVEEAPLFVFTLVRV